MTTVCGFSHAQSIVSNLQVYGDTLNVQIQQIGGAVLGGSARTATLDGDNLYVNINQFGSNGIRTNVHVRDDASSASQININQGSPSKYTTNSQVDLRVGEHYKASAQHIDINQTDSNAYAALNVANTGAVVGADIKIAQGESSLLNMYLMKGNNQVVNIQQSANAIANIVSNGNNFQAQINQAPSTNVSITNTGNFNTYNVNTQKTGDNANLVIYGNNNQFNFDFNTYRSVSIKTSSSQSVNGGNFMVGPLNTLFDANNIASNINAAANAIVVKR